VAKRFVILGAGESGIGTAILAQQKGFDVFVSDSKAIVPFYREQLIANGIAFEEGKHTTELILNADEVMKSPGIPEKVEIVIMIRAKGIQICSEIDFASRYTDAFLIGITGSNGKSTTTTLIHHLLVKGGLNAALVGNIGKSFALAVAQGGYDYYVIEVSNFQLDDIHTFRPNIAVLLNITPDHLDRYTYQMAGYVHSKFRITENQTAEDYFIYCADDPVLKEEMPKRSTKAQMIPFSIETEISNGAYLQNETLTFNINQKPNFTMSIYELSLQGKHNQHNSLAAGIAANIVNVRNEIIRESMRDFENLEHRMEPVLTIKGIDFINDSKATNVNSTWYALESINKPVIWIAGGLDKGNDYTVLQSLVKEKVKAIICLGKDNR